ncbi:rCG35883 [Rattus norvegicus]|uniref:RCG35883 n=1 Tax=Rattus norvegicus TaxID=10116 RepID=A6IJM7_RAT|nr:rCG35883 [Rattus norvegicus]
MLIGTASCSWADVMFVLHRASVKSPWRVRQLSYRLFSNHSTKQTKWIKQAAYAVQQLNQVKKTDGLILSPALTCSASIPRAIHGYTESLSPRTLQASQEGKNTGTG